MPPDFTSGGRDEGERIVLNLTRLPEPGESEAWTAEIEAMVYAD